MQISLSVPYDAQLVRRTLMFLARPQLLPFRLAGGLLVLAGILLLVLDLADLLGYAFIVGGVGLLFGFAPLAVAFSLRALPEAIRQGFHMTLDDEWVQVSYTLVETRFRWAALARVVETPEVWYLMFGKQQAMTVPKFAMTPEQQAEFAAFVARLRPTAAR